MGFIKKIFTSLLIVMILSQFFGLNQHVEASTNKIGIIHYWDGKYLKSSVSSSTNTVIYDIPSKEIVNILQENASGSGSGCGTSWHKVEYKGLIGYICGTNVEIVNRSDINDEFKNYVQNNFPEIIWEDIYLAKTVNPNQQFTPLEQSFIDNIKNNFPNTYWNKIFMLKTIYPNWNFVANKTNLNWDSVIQNQNKDGKSLIQSSNTNYLQKDDASYDSNTNTYKPKDGSSWYNANSRAIAYYMDPRNFIDSSNIFMFEKLSFVESSRNVEIARKILSGNPLTNYPEFVVEAGRNNQISSTHLASRIRQEIGGSTRAVSGQEPGYVGYYNFYNIGATSSSDPVILGLQRAISEGWDSPEKAIKGGAAFIGNAYIKKGQDTPYFQKWNVSSYTQFERHTHQYMTNIQAPVKEASITYSAYVDLGILSDSMTFEIPVYNNMPVKTELPLGTNNNNNLSMIKINGINVDNFDKNTKNYTIYIDDDKQSINVEAIPEDASARVYNTGNINLNTKETNLSLIVISQDGGSNEYKLTVIKDDKNTVKLNNVINNLNVSKKDNKLNNLNQNNTVEKLIRKVQNVEKDVLVGVFNSNNEIKTSGKLATGDKIIFSYNNKTIEFRAIVKGDSSKDGEITLLDLLQVQKHILATQKLDELSYEAADVNSDGDVGLLDLLRIQLHLLGVNEIKGEVINEN